MKTKLWILLLLHFVGAFLLPGAALAQVLIHQTIWAGGAYGSASAGAAGTTTGAGDGWIDVAGGQASLHSSPFYLSILGGTAPFSTGEYILRPTSESVLNEQFVFYYITNSASNANYYAVLRYQGSNTCYFAGVNQSAAGPPIKTVIDSNASGTLTTHGGNSFGVTPANGDIVCVTASAVGVSPTVLTVTAYDTTTSTTLATSTYSDSTSSLQVTGQQGIMSYNGTATGTGEVTEMADYNMSAPAISVSPTTATAGTNETVTVTGTNLTTPWTTTAPTFTASLGSLSAETVTSATTVTFTLTPGSSAGTATLTDTSDTGSPTAAIVVNAATASSYTTTGPTGGTVSVASGNFTVTPNAAYTGTITPSVSSGPTGTFSPTSLTWSSSVAAQTFTFTPSTAGTSVITTTSSPTITNTSGSLNYVVSGVPVTVGCNSTAIHYSPANWAGSSGRTGSTYFRTWNMGAYFSAYWSTTSTSPTCQLNLSNSYGSSYISYFIDNSYYDNVAVPTSGSITIPVSGAGSHVLTVYTRNSSVAGGRWVESNAWTFTGLTLDSNATAGTAPTWNGKWILEIGDSITEGYNADPNSYPDNMWDYSHLAGESYLFNGYDYSVDACCTSGWIAPGDTASDVSPYYAMSGTAGSKTYAGNSASRWCNIDSTTGLLDTNGQISAYGSTGQIPAAITINYATNEAMQGLNITDMTNSIVGCLSALRSAAPSAWIIVFVPFNLYDTNISNYAGSAPYISALKSAVASYQSAHTSDAKTILIDYGSGFAYQLGSILTLIHPNATGHALIAPKVSGTVLSKLSGSIAPSGRGRTLK